jgi:hypothetical protein
MTNSTFNNSELDVTSSSTPAVNPFTLSPSKVRHAIIERTFVQEAELARTLIGEFVELGKKSVAKMVEIGKVLVPVKAKLLKDRTWASWVKQHLPVTLRTADRWVEIASAKREYLEVDFEQAVVRINGNRRKPARTKPPVKALPAPAPAPAPAYEEAYPEAEDEIKQMFDLAVWGIRDRWPKLSGAEMRDFFDLAVGGLEFMEQAEPEAYRKMITDFKE